jgi:hypothetical protein
LVGWPISGLGQSIGITTIFLIDILEVDGIPVSELELVFDLTISMDSEKNHRVEVIERETSIDADPL